MNITDNLMLMKIQVFCNVMVLCRHAPRIFHLGWGADPEATYNLCFKTMLSKSCHKYLYMLHDSLTRFKSQALIFFKFV